MMATALAKPQFSPFGRPIQNSQFANFQSNQFPFQNNQANQFNANQIQPNQFQPNQFQSNQFQQNQFPFQANEPPFQSNESNDFNGFPPIVSTTPAAAAPTTASPAYIQCMRNCLTTNEYNPVCGTDAITYNNERRLGCANQCGRALNSNWQGKFELKKKKCYFWSKYETTVYLSRLKNSLSVVTVARNGNCASGQKVA